MKKYSIFLLFFFTSCFVNPSGRIVFYDFNATKQEVEKALVDNIGEDSACTACSSWLTISEKDDPNSIYINFKVLPKESYLLGFTCDSLDWATNPNSRLALEGVNYGNGWKFRRDLDSKEKERIQKRFEAEVLSKIKYPYFKRDETGTCAGM